MFQHKSTIIILLSIMVSQIGVPAFALDIMLTTGTSQTHTLGISYSELEQAFAADFKMSKLDKQLHGKDVYLGVLNNSKDVLVATVTDRTVTSVILLYKINPTMTRDEANRLYMIILKIVAVTCKECNRQRGVFIQWLTDSHTKLANARTSTSISKIFGNIKTSLEGQIGGVYQMFKVEPIS